MHLVITSSLGYGFFTKLETEEGAVTFGRLLLFCLIVCTAACFPLPKLIHLVRLRLRIETSKMLFGCFSTGFSASPRALATRSRVADSAVSMKWGEHIGEREWNHGPDGRASQLTRDHGKLVITLATTGNINTRENNAALPCSPKEMADDMHECIKAGVSVLHIHARNELLKPTMRVDRAQPNPSP